MNTEQKITVVLNKVPDKDKVITYIENKIEQERVRLQDTFRAVLSTRTADKLTVNNKGQ